jgi:hypothetical protein
VNEGITGSGSECGGINDCGAVSGCGGDFSSNPGGCGCCVGFTLPLG